MAAKSVTPALVGLAVSGVVIGGLLWWGHDRDVKRRAQMAKDDPTITPIGLFPALKVGDVVIVDPVAARLPAPFDQLPRVPAQVDMVLQDPSVVSVQTPPGAKRGAPGVPFFSGTIPKAAILSVLPPVSFEV